MLTINDVDLIGKATNVEGGKGAGKTTLLGNIARMNKRALILDPVGSSPGRTTLIDYADNQIPITGSDVEETIVQGALDQVRSLWDQGKVVGFDCSALVGKQRQEFGDLVGRHALGKLHHGLIIVDEVQWFAPQGSFHTAPGLCEVAGKGRNHDLGLITSGHRFAPIDKNLIELTNVWIIMRLQGKNNLEDARKHLQAAHDPIASGISWDALNDAIDKIPTLGVGEYLIVA